MKSAEMRAKMSAVKMGHPFWGLKHHTVETKTKMSTTALGHAFRGLKHYTPEMCAKISVAGMGNTHALGYRRSEEARAKQSAIMIGSLNPSWRGGITPEKMSGYKRKANAKRRGLGYIYLNSWFVGCEGHHINETDVIYLPRKLHHSIYHNQWTGQGMAEMNALAGQYLTEDWT